MGPLTQPLATVQIDPGRLLSLQADDGEHGEREEGLLDWRQDGRLLHDSEMSLSASPASEQLAIIDHDRRHRGRHRCHRRCDTVALIPFAGSVAATVALAATATIPELTHSHLFGSGCMQTSVLVIYCFYPTAGGTTLTPNRTAL